MKEGLAQTMCDTKGASDGGFENTFLGGRPRPNGIAAWERREVDSDLPLSDRAQQRRRDDNSADPTLRPEF